MKGYKKVFKIRWFVRNFLAILIIMFLSLSANAEIDEKMSCDITYYNNVNFQGMNTGNIDNKAHTMKPYYFIDNKNQKLYNSDMKLIANAIFKNGTISTDWESTDDPRFCLFFNKNNKTVQYKAFFTMPAKPIGNTGHIMPPSITKSNGHGTCTFEKI